MLGAMKMGLKLKDREIDQMDAAEEILLERELKDERMDRGLESGQETKRRQWADGMSDRNDGLETDQCERCFGISIKLLSEKPFYP